MFTDLKAGDLIVADATSGLGVCVFISYVGTDQRASRWIIAKVEPQAYQASQGVMKHFCKICGSLIADIHTACAHCTTDVGRNDAIMLIDSDDD